MADAIRSWLAILASDVKMATDEQCTNADEESLLQVSQEVARSPLVASKSDMTVSPSNSHTPNCLRFMHIPKTAGSSIDTANFNLSPKRDFDSLTHELYEKICRTDHSATMQKYCTEPGGLGQLFAKTHSNNTFLQIFMEKHKKDYTFIPQPFGGYCQNVHTSPDVGAGPRKFYSGPCPVFCATRNPLHRYISGFAMANIGRYANAGVAPCSPEGFEQATRVFIAKLHQNRFQEQCWFTPQVEMVYGALSKEAATTQYCTEILRFEHIDKDFKQLMAKFGHNLQMPKWNVMGHTNAYKAEDGQNCYMDINKITTATKEMVYNYYKADFEAFNYSRPF